MLCPFRCGFVGKGLCSGGRGMRVVCLWACRWDRPSRFVSLSAAVAFESSTVTRRCKGALETYSSAVTAFCGRADANLFALGVSHGFNLLYPTRLDESMQKNHRNRT